MNKIEEIFRSWGVALRPDDKQIELAVARLKICEGCEFKGDLPIRHCTV